MKFLGIVLALIGVVVLVQAIGAAATVGVLLLVLGNQFYESKGRE